MRTRVQKWGNSLAIRIPRAFAAQAGIERDASVELTLEAGKLVVVPALPDVPTLDELLSGITPENLHDEVTTGPAVGAEGW
jgi:antitoxin MazE